jgi:soluble lytic murein transglycosylase-like protein
MYRVARCESGFNPDAYNSYSGASGLFQFMPGTFYAYASRIGEWRSLWNPFASANVAAYMASRGQQYQWSCN